MAERARPLGITVLAGLAGIGCVLGIAVTLIAIGVEAWSLYADFGS